MSKKKKLAMLASTLGLVIVSAGPDYHRTRSRTRCYIPSRDYQYKRFSQPLRSLSNVPVAINVPFFENLTDAIRPGLGIANTLDGRQMTIKSFQFVKDPVLKIDHCSISEMSVVIEEDGRWTVSLRANQNPLNEQEILNVTTIERRQLFTDHLRRNKFHVDVKCFVGANTTDGNILIGKPFVIPLEVDPFWVQRQRPYHMIQGGNYPEIQRYFKAIDRVEIEFRYERD